LVIFYIIMGERAGDVLRQKIIKWGEKDEESKDKTFDFSL